MERCEFCGRFGAKRGKYDHPISKAGHITLYLCKRCDTEQRKHDQARKARGEQ